MHIISGTAPGALRPARLRELTREARLRLQWMDYYEACGRNAALTCRRFGISRQTFYRWKRRYKPRELSSLESGSHRPRRLRQPTWTNGCVERAQRTHQEEFYEVYPGDLEIAPLSRALQDWEQVYNHIHPHQALGYLTPHQYLLKCQKGKEEVSLII